MQRLLISLAALALSAPAVAQGPAAPQSLSREERRALQPIVTAYQQRNYQAVIAGAQAVATQVGSPFARYLVGQMQFEAGIQTGSVQAQQAGIEAMVASGAAPANTLRGLQINQAALALRNDQPVQAETVLTRVVQANPSDPEALAQLAEVKLRLSSDPRRGGNSAQRAARRTEGVAMYQRALQLGDTSGRPLRESFYRRAAALAFDANQREPAIAASQRLVARFPTPVNWRDALLQYRDLTPGDAEVALDVGRLLMRSNALAGERDYTELATALLTANRGIEASSVLAQGTQRGMLGSEPAVRELVTRATRAATTERAGLAARRTQARAAATGAAARQLGDTLLAQDQYAEAAEFYRLALQKGENADLVNTRLGLALGLAGQRAEAETALRAVTGPRSGLAGYTLILLSQAGAPRPAA